MCDVFEWGGCQTPPPSKSLLLLGGSDPPPSKSVLLLGGVDPPPSKSVLLLGGVDPPPRKSDVLIWAPPPWKRSAGALIERGSEAVVAEAKVVWGGEISPVEARSVGDWSFFFFLELYLKTNLLTHMHS